MQVFKSVLFKSKGELFLGLIESQERFIKKFIRIENSISYNSLQENQFSIVMVEVIGKNKFNLFDLQIISFQPDSHSDIITIGELDDDTLFDSANNYLIDHSKITIH